MARVCWWFYFSKVIELSDTVSMMTLFSLLYVSCYFTSSRASTFCVAASLIFRFSSSCGKRTSSCPSSTSTITPQWSSTGGPGSSTWRGASVSEHQQHTMTRCHQTPTSIDHESITVCPVLSTHSIPDRADQLPGSRGDVRVLRPGSSGTEYDQTPLVETLPDLPAAGLCLFFLWNLWCLGHFLQWAESSLVNRDTERDMELIDWRKVKKWTKCKLTLLQNRTSNHREEK